MNAGARGWQRLGPIDSALADAPWASTHLALPVVAAAGSPGRWLLYASSRDPEGRSSIGRARFWMEPEPRILGPHEQVLAPGELGCFDDRGVTMSCLVSAGSQQFLYYTGWMLGRSVPFYLAIGLAVSSDDGRTFHRVSRAPILDRTATDPFLTASPFVLRESGRWRMWYVSGARWQSDAAGVRHFYYIKYAESEDGVTWTRHERPCIDFASPDEHAFGRPYVRRDAGVFRMWYSYRGARYRIGYAESSDGLDWRRFDDERGLRPAGGTDWDSDMVAYPWLFEHRGRVWMLYNGNGYGASGIGLAVWREGDPKGGRSVGAW